MHSVPSPTIDMLTKEAELYRDMIIEQVRAVPTLRAFGNIEPIILKLLGPSISLIVKDLER